MAKATITIKDMPDGAQQVIADFGVGMDNESAAHRLTAFVLQAIKEVHEGDEPAEFVPASQETRPHPVTGA